VVVDDKGKVKKITGNSCSKGEKYALRELINPKRVLTSTVRVVNGKKSVIAVKTNKPVLLNQMMICMKEVNAFRAKAPIKSGAVLIKDIAKSGADLVATGETK